MKFLLLISNVCFLMFESVFFAADCHRGFEHEIDGRLPSGVKVYLKDEERVQFKDGSIYAAFINFDTWPPGIQDIIMPFKKVGVSYCLAPLTNKDKLVLRALNREWREKFILDINVSMEDMQTKRSFRKYLEKMVACVTSQSMVRFYELNGEFVTCIGELLSVNSHVKSIHFSLKWTNAPCFIDFEQIIKKSENLRVLTVSDACVFRSDSLATIVHCLKNNSSLVSLSLRDSGVGDESVPVLCDMIQCNTFLRSLDLSCNNIGYMSFYNFQKALEKNTVLEILDLRKNSDCQYSCANAYEGDFRMKLKL